MTGMTISDLEFYRVEIACAGQQAPVWSLVVRLATDSGLEGWGEARIPWRSAELAARRNALLPVLAGRSVFDVEDLLGLEVLRLAPLRCALEMASWDLVGRAVRQPLCHLFGGNYRHRVPLAVRLCGGSSDEIAQLGRELAAQGFHSQIIPSSGSLRGDVETVAAVREVACERAELRFDALASYDMETARELCNQLEGDGLQFVIDPLRTLELAQVASLGRQTTVPLAVCRAIQQPADVLALIRCGAAPFVVVDPQAVGGMVAARKCAAIAEAAGLVASLGGEPSLGIGVAAMLQLAASTPPFASCNECSYHQLQDDLLAEPLEIIDGTIAVPGGPGLGVDVDRAKVEYYQVN